MFQLSIFFSQEINDVVEVVDNTEQVPFRKPRPPSTSADDPPVSPAQSVVPIIYSIKIALKVNKF